MRGTIGIRREDKYRWERRAPLTPSHVRQLTRDHAIQVVVQPSPLRVFPEEAYRESGAVVQEDLSNVGVVLGIKEIPLDALEPRKTYVFFSHTVKGQAYNMPLLKRMMALECRLIDYERITDDDGRRLVLFGRHAGLAGMIESLHALGKRVQAEGLDPSQNPFVELRQPYQYRNLQEAQEHLRKIGLRITREGLPESLTPFVVGFLGYGNVSLGAQEILACLPVSDLRPEDLLSVDPGALSNKTLYRVIFKEENTVAPIVDSVAFSLNHYHQHPDQYGSVFSRYLPHLTVLVNAVYWDQRHPVLVTAQDLKRLFAGPVRPRLRVIGDITCDIEGAIAVTRKATLPDEPSYVYDTVNDRIVDGVAALTGPVIMAVDILPTEFPVEASETFGDALLPLLPALAASDPPAEFSDWRLPEPLKRAVVLYNGKLTESYRYLESHLE